MICLVGSDLSGRKPRTVVICLISRKPKTSVLCLVGSVLDYCCLSGRRPKDLGVQSDAYGLLGNMVALLSCILVAILIL